MQVAAMKTNRSLNAQKKRRHLKKLEKVLRAINLKIKKLEEREVDWDEEDNSAYCKLDRYRAQFTKIYTKICEIKGKLPDADRPYLRKVSFAGTTYPHINRCIEKFYNKHREFPDFQDIKKLVTAALKQEGIEMPPIKIHTMAASAFKEFGEMLKRLRQYDDYDVLVSYLEQQIDPARDNDELQEQLNRNALLFKKREQEVIDKFAEQDAGICSESGQDSDKLKKKKRKIIITNPSSKKKPLSPVKNHLSDNDDSNEEGDSKAKSSVSLNSDSDSSVSGSEDDVKKSSVKNKGKTLIGKQRIVKRGVKKNPPKKCQGPSTVMSSDEESAPKNSKESLTSYLGLQGRNSTKTTKTKESKHILESEDEVTYVTEIQRPSEGPLGKLVAALSENSDSDKATKTKPKGQKAASTMSSSSHSSRSASKDNEDSQIKINTIPDSDSDIEPVAVVTRPKTSSAVNTQKPMNQARKRTGSLSTRVAPTKQIVNKSKINTRETINASSGSESRTSEESESDGKKSISDVELSAGIKDLSSDSSDVDVGKKTAEKTEDEDTIVILSEDVLEDPKPAAPKQKLTKPQDESSDDDICILSQVETERRTVAPRRTKPNSCTSNPPQRTNPATSTPLKTYKPSMKRRLSNQANSENNKRPRNLSLTTNGNGRQTTLPQVINGASRKVIISRVTKSAATTSESIPLIEID